MVQISAETKNTRFLPIRLILVDKVTWVHVKYWEFYHQRMWCIRWGCCSLNQRSQIRTLGIEKSLIGNASPELSHMQRESGSVGLQCEYRTPDGKPKKLKKISRFLPIYYLTNIGGQSYVCTCEISYAQADLKHPWL